MMNAILLLGSLILAFGTCVWVYGIYITWKGYKTRGIVTGHDFFKEYDFGNKRYYNKEYPTLTYFTEEGLKVDGHVKYLVSKLDRLKVGEEIDILIYKNKVYYGHDMSMPFFFYVGLGVIIIGLIYEAFTLNPLP